MNGGENSEGWRAKFCKFLKCFCECFEKKGENTESCNMQNQGAKGGDKPQSSLERTKEIVDFLAKIATMSVPPAVFAGSLIFFWYGMNLKHGFNILTYLSTTDFIVIFSIVYFFTILTLAFLLFAAFLIADRHIKKSSIICIIIIIITIIIIFVLFLFLINWSLNLNYNPLIILIIATGIGLYNAFLGISIGKSIKEGKNDWLLVLFNFLFFVPIVIIIIIMPLYYNREVLKFTNYADKYACLIINDKDKILKSAIQNNKNTNIFSIFTCSDGENHCITQKSVYVFLHTKDYLIITQRPDEQGKIPKGSPVLPIPTSVIILYKDAKKDECCFKEVNQQSTQPPQTK